MNDEIADLAVVVQKAYEFNLWMLPHAEKFPRTYRFSLGQNLVQGSLGLLMNLVDATYQSRNTAPLAAAMRDINRVRFLVRLSKDLHVLDLKSYEFASGLLDEIGRMTGGWWKSAATAAGNRRSRDAG